LKGLYRSHKGRISSEFLVNLEVRLELLRPILDHLDVTVGFYGSASSPKMVSIRSGTFWGPVFGRGVEEFQGPQGASPYLIGEDVTLPGGKTLPCGILPRGLHGSTGISKETGYDVASAEAPRPDPECLFVTYL